jgi:LysR family transcriptional regulator, transcriptional activator of the cysJI operon
LRPNKVYDAVLNAEVDLGILSYPQVSADLNIIPLRSEKMVVVCHLTHPLTKHHTVKAAQLQGEDFVAFDRDLHIRKEIDRYLRQHEASVRVAMEFDNIETIKQAVQIGTGISILPEPTVRAEVTAGSLVAIRLDPIMHRPIGIIHRQRKVFTPTAVKFIEMLQKLQNPCTEDE